MKKRLLSLLLAALLLLAPLPAASADAALSGEEELLELFAEKKAAGAEEFEFTCEKALFQSLMADNAARLSVLEIKGGVAEARIRYSEQGCLIRLSDVKYSDDPWAECATEEQAGEALRGLLEEGHTGLSLLCSPALAKELADSAVLRSYAALAGFENLKLTYFASGVIQARDPEPFETAWAPAEDSAQFDAAVEGFALLQADDFTVSFSPAFYQTLTEDEEQLNILHASSLLDRYSCDPGSVYGTLCYTRASYTHDPCLVCRSWEELQAAISHMGALKLTSFRLYLADDGLREDLMDTPLAYLHHNEAEAGLMYDVQISHNNYFVFYTNAHYTHTGTLLGSREEARDYLDARARACAGEISLYCTPELYTELAGEEGAYLESRDCLDEIYAMIEAAGIRSYDLALNRPGGAVRVRVFAYAPGLALLQASANGAEEELSPEERDCLEAARALARNCRGNEPAETAALVREALSGIAILPESGEDPQADTAVGALLRGEASPRGLLDAFYLVGSLAGLEMHYPVFSLTEPQTADGDAGLLPADGTWMELNEIWILMLPDQNEEAEDQGR